MLDIQRFPYDPCAYHYLHESNSYSFSKEESSDQSEEEGIPAPMSINGKKIEFTINEACQPSVICNDQEVSSLAEAVAQLKPADSIRESDLTKWAILINYLTSGTDYQLIKSAEKNKKTDESALQKNHRSMNYPCLADQFSKKDLKQIRAPFLTNNELIFYVQKNNVPYRVATSIGTGRPPKVAYQTLIFN